MSLSVDANARKLQDGPGYALEVRVEYRNNTKELVLINRSESEVVLSNTKFRPIERYTFSNIPDAVPVPPGGSYNFEMTFQTNAELHEEGHTLRCTVGRESTHCLV